jgi:hypothetical protein
MEGVFCNKELKISINFLDSMRRISLGRAQDFEQLKAPRLKNVGFAPDRLGLFYMTNSRSFSRK